MIAQEAGVNEGGPGADPVRAIAPWLRAPEAAIRSAAARALAALPDIDSVPPLLEALADPDPDVRADAMAGLARCARLENAPLILRSLERDPVSDVKAAAIRALARLRDPDSLPVLRALARSRCEAEIAWEDADEGWDDWLDIQLEAITALGSFGRDDVVEDLMRAREDEFGQNLDHAVFSALAVLPSAGIPALLGFLRHESARVRARALAALSEAAPDSFRPMREALARDPDPQVRRLAVDCFDPPEPELAELAWTDGSAVVRNAALARAAPHRSNIVRQALIRGDDESRAIALESLHHGSGLPEVPDLAANVEAWLSRGNPRLASASAAALPALQGPRSVDALTRAALEPAFPESVRIDALRALATVATQSVPETLRVCTRDSAAPVQVAAFSALATLANGNGPSDAEAAARRILIESVRGVSPDGARLELTSAEGSGSARQQPVSTPVQITPDGAIVPRPEGRADDAAPYPMSTLDSIQAPRTANPPPASAEEEDVDGFLVRTRMLAIRVAGECQGAGIDEALESAVLVPHPGIRAAALDAAARLAAAVPAPGVLAAAIQELRGSDAAARAAAVRLLARKAPPDEAARCLAPLIGDRDPQIRAAAIKVVATRNPEVSIQPLCDPAPVVRLAAVDAVAATGCHVLVERAIRYLVDGGHILTLRDASCAWPGTRQVLFAMLGEAYLTRRCLLVVLEVLTGAVESDSPRSVRRTGSPLRGRRT